MRREPIVIACLLTIAPSPVLAAPVFHEIAREFSDGLQWLDADVRPALSESGQVAFVGGTDFHDYGGDVLFFGDGGALGSRPSGMFEVSAVKIHDDGQLLFIAHRDAGEEQRGVYGADTSAPGFRTLHEVPFDDLGSALDTPSYVTSNLALSPNGTLAFSTIRNGAGAIHRGSITGPLSVLQSGSGTFFNVRELDVNDAGSVAVQMEYVDPTAGLSRGILIFDEPEQPLLALRSAIERLAVSVQPMPRINASGQVAFALNSPVELLFFDPPGVYTDPPAGSVTLPPGVYVVSPAGFGEPKTFTRIVGTTGPYASFGQVDINDEGLVVFTATLDAGGYGIFTGPDPVLHKVAAQADVVDGSFFSWLRMGELNNAGEISLITSDWYSTDRQVWRVGGLVKYTPRGGKPRAPFGCSRPKRLPGHRALLCLSP